MSDREKWFAWRPVRLKTGNWRWLIYVYREWDIYGGNTCEPTGWCVPCGDWVYTDL